VAQGYAGSLGAASAINKAAKLAGAPTTATFAVDNCTSFELGLEVTMQTDYSITAQAIATTGSVTQACTVTGPTGTTAANFVGHGDA